MSERLQGLLNPVGHPRGGISPDYRKMTKDMPIRDLESPDEVVILMAQHIGVPCQPTVKKGDVVSIGDVIGDSEANISAPVHSSVSGTVKEIREMTLDTNRKSLAVVITNDGEDRFSEKLAPPLINTPEDLVKAARDCGLVGLGGAGFPTHVKLNVKPGTIDTLIVNAAECEPYVAVDQRLMIEKTELLLPALEKITSVLNIPHVVIGIEDNKPECIEAVSNILPKFNGDADIKVMKLPTHYPQGAEKVLVQSATGRLIPPGKLPLDVGCIMINVATVMKFSDFILTGRPLTHRTICITGSAYNEPQNVRVPVGIVITDLFDKVGGLREEPNRILMGGPMMGIALESRNMPIIKQNNALLAMTDAEVVRKKQRNCIRCGRCHQACPLNLMPMVYGLAVKHRDKETLVDYGIDVCMDCGCCSYVCPSGIPLVQLIRDGKALLRKGGEK